MLIRHFVMCVFLAELTCSKPPDVDNAVAMQNATQFLPNQTVEYQCINGFKQDQYNNLTCSEKGIWIGKISSCIGCFMYQEYM